MEMFFFVHNLQTQKRKKNPRKTHTKSHQNVPVWSHWFMMTISISIQRLAKSRMHYALIVRQYFFGVRLNKYWNVCHLVRLRLWTRPNFTSPVDSTQHSWWLTILILREFSFFCVSFSDPNQTYEIRTRFGTRSRWTCSIRETVHGIVENFQG